MAGHRSRWPTPRACDTRQIFAAVEQGQPWATALIDDAADHLAAALLDLQRLIDPEVVVLGGGIGLLPAFRNRVIGRLEREADHASPTIKPASLGGDPGIIGIADIALKSTAC